MRVWYRHLSVMVLILGLALIAPHARTERTWRSTLYPDEWVPGYKDGLGRFLHDFSYAGYHSGERTLPKIAPGMRVDVTQPPYNADPTGRASATLAIQRAINDVGRAGGGVIYLPAGTYRLTFATPGSNQALLISWSGVLLQGEGSDRTFLLLDETVTRSKALIRVEPLGGLDWYRALPASEQRIREDLLEPTSQIPLVDSPKFQVGDWVALTHDTTAEWVREHNMVGLWPPGAVQGQLFFRRVTAVDTEANSITIDAPTRYYLKIRDNARVHKVSAPIEEVGLEGFSIGMRQNALSGWGNNEHSVAGTGAYQVHGSRAITVRGAVNSWIQDVATFRPSGNSYAHIHSIGLEVTHSRNITVRHVRMENPQYLGGGGNGYPFVIGGQDSLFHHVRGINGRHPITITGGRTNGNVVLAGYISTPHSLASDFHAFLSVANLIDNLTIDRDRFEAGDRSHASGTGGLSHGASTSQSVFWNIEGLAYKQDGSRGNVIVWSEQYGWGYVIGTRGAAFQVGVGTGIRNRPVDLVEGEGEGRLLRPESLYMDQLQRRLMREGKEEVWEEVRSELTL